MLLWSKTDEPNNSYFYQSFPLIAMTMKFLLNTLDGEVFFVINFIGLHVKLAKVLRTVIIKNLKTMQNPKQKDNKKQFISYCSLFYITYW